MDKIKVLLAIISIITILCCNNGDPINTITESGTIESTSSIISAESNGNVTSIYFSEGDRITEGDTLLEIDHELLDLQLKQAEAGFTAAEAKYELLKNGAREEDKTLAKQKLIEAEAALKLTNENFNRMKNLYEAKAITKKQFDEVSTQLDISSARFKSAEANLNKLENFARPEELKQAKANLENAETNIELLKKRISDCYIVSPSDGYVVTRFIELGETAVPMSSLFKISDLSQIEISIYVSETNLGKVKLGQNAEISIDSYPDKKFRGTVSYISPEAEFTPKTIQTKEERTKLVYKVKVEVENEDLILKEGMPADVTVKL